MRTLTAILSCMVVIQHAMAADSDVGMDSQWPVQSNAVLKQDSAHASLGTFFIGAGPDGYDDGRGVVASAVQPGDTGLGFSMPWTTGAGNWVVGLSAPDREPVSEKQMDYAIYGFDRDSPSMMFFYKGAQVDAEGKPATVYPGYTVNGFLGPKNVISLERARGTVVAKLIASADLPYQVARPADWDAKKKYPLLVYLHPAGDRGADNQKQLGWGTREWIEQVVTQYQAVVVAPQCPVGQRWVEVDWALQSHDMPKEMSRPMRQLLELLPTLEKEFAIDPARRYIVGSSMGGYGAWDALCRKPDYFAAGVPVCGGADEKQAAPIAKVNVWVFHGGDDPLVPVARSRNMVEAMKKAGGSPKYTEYPPEEKVGHGAWNKASIDLALLPWIFAQKRPGAVAALPVATGAPGKVSWDARVFTGAPSVRVLCAWSQPDQQVKTPLVYNLVISRYSKTATLESWDPGHNPILSNLSLFDPTRKDEKAAIEKKEKTK